MSSIFDVVEDAGHKLTILGGPYAGESIYWCEGCGSVLIIRRLDADDAIFQAPKGSYATKAECTNQTTETPLSAQIRERHHESLDRLRAGAIGLPIDLK